MAEYAQLKAAINAVIKQNGRMEITGEVLNQVLTAMVNSLGRSMGCAGVATPTTNPQNPDQNLFYFAVQAGTYVNFNSIVLPAGISVLMWNGTWTAQTWFTIKETPEYQSTDFISAGGVFDSQKVDGNAYDISEHFPTGGVNNTNEYTLQGALTKIPANMYKAGMAIKFKESTTHNYMVFTHVGSDTTNFTSVNLWQSVANSNELFHSPTAFMRKQIPTIGAVLDEFGTQNVQTLPTPSNATMNRIFVVQSKHPETDNIKTEWITIKVGNTYQWECIGGDTTGIYDLSDAMAVGGEPATYGSLSDALAAVPADKKRAGMTLAFIGLYADMYSLSNYENDVAPTFNAVEVDPVYLYGEKNYTLAELQDMFSSLDGEPIIFPTQVGDELFLYSINASTLYNIQRVRLLTNQRVYEQYRFIGTDINDFSDESLWIKETRVSTANNELSNERNYVTEDDIETLKPDWENMQNVIWDELVELRDNGNLVAGKFYRITDYECTTTQEETSLEGKVFDIIVLALTSNSLSERAWATQNAEDDNFTNSNLVAWQLWYCLDNDTNRFAWADTQFGKGVIYRMIDEFGNDCPYDFKNIQFTRTACEVEGEQVFVALIGLTTGYDNTTLPNQDDTNMSYLFTFIHFGSDGELIDMSIDGSAKGNIIEPRYNNDGAMELPNVVLTNLTDNINIYNNVLGSGVHRITMIKPSKVTARNAYIYNSYFLNTIENCNFDGCSINSCLFNFASVNSQFSYATISTTTINGEINSCDFTNANINNSNINVKVNYSNFVNSQITTLQMTADIDNSDFSSATFNNVEINIELWNANTISHCNFSRCNFYDAILEDLDIRYCNFSNANINTGFITGVIENCDFNWLHNVGIRGGSLNPRISLQYLAQVGKVDGGNEGMVYPSLKTDVNYVQVLTCDELSNIVVREPYA